MPVTKTVGKKTTTRTSLPVKPIDPLSEVVAKIRELQRWREGAIARKIGGDNKVLSYVAMSLGYVYDPDMRAEVRAEWFAKASAHIEEVKALAGEKEASERIAGILIWNGRSMSLAYDAEIARIEKPMCEAAEGLPASVLEWARHEDQRGFSKGTLLALARVIGETGDLGNYANPGKVWKRMGCAPAEDRFGEVLAPATLMRSQYKGHMTKTMWEEYGYCPRRHSIMWNIAECLIKQNRNPKTGWVGPYRRRYDEAKLRFYELHKNDWKWNDCTSCKGTAMNCEGPCLKCRGTGKQCRRADLHGHTVMAKLLLKNLWRAWNRDRDLGADHGEKKFGSNRPVMGNEAVCDFEVTR